MSIILPTLDELEAWWEAHPTVAATTCDECQCIIAVPLFERYVDAVVTVVPSSVAQDGTRREGTVTVHHMAGDEWVALPKDLDRLAKEFDELRDEWDENDDEADDHQEINAANCVALIQRVKGEL